MLHKTNETNNTGGNNNITEVLDTNREQWSALISGLAPQIRTKFVLNKQSVC